MLLDLDTTPEPALPTVRPGNAAGFETVWFKADDGVALNLRHMPADAGASARGPVLMSAGTSVRANIFSPPNADTLPQFLSRAGYDVWVLNWRASIDLPARDYVLDDGAALDFPAAVRTIRQRTGSDTLKAVVHCQGSSAFTLAAVAGLLPEVSVAVCNSVALHPDVQIRAALKGPTAMALLPKVLDELNSQWGLHVQGFGPRVAVWLMRAGHHECNNAVCKMTSFIYGTGFPALWRHENLSDATHEWLKGEFAQLPIGFLVQTVKCVRAGRLLTTGRYPHLLPLDATGQAPRTDTRFVFMTGDLNETFLPTGMARSFDFFERFAPGRHTFQKLHGYSHLDPFIGKHAATDVFGFVLDELNRG